MLSPALLRIDYHDRNYFLGYILAKISSQNDAGIRKEASWRLCYLLEGIQIYITQHIYLLDKHFWYYKQTGSVTKKVGTVISGPLTSSTLKS